MRFKNAYRAYGSVVEHNNLTKGKNYMDAKQVQPVTTPNEPEKIETKPEETAAPTAPTTESK